jgi:hypothetical protein
MNFGQLSDGIRLHHQAHHGHGDHGEPASGWPDSSPYYRIDTGDDGAGDGGNQPDREQGCDRNIMTVFSGKICFLRCPNRSAFQTLGLQKIIHRLGFALLPRFNRKCGLVIGFGVNLAVERGDQCRLVQPCDQRDVRYLGEGDGALRVEHCRPHALHRPALIVANQFLEGQIAELQAAVSNGYARGKFEPVPRDRKDWYD